MGRDSVRDLGRNGVHELVHAAFGITGGRGRGRGVSTDAGDPIDELLIGHVAHGDGGGGDVHSTAHARIVATYYETIQPCDKIERETCEGRVAHGIVDPGRRARIQPFNGRVHKARVRGVGNGREGEGVLEHESIAGP